MARKGAPKGVPKGVKLVASNRRARYDYDILDTYEAGLALVGSEVKSLRTSKVQMSDAYAAVDDGEAWLHRLHIAPYSHSAGHSGHDPERKRKLLLHREQIDELAARTNQERLTIVPLAIYFKEGRAKVEIALARGRRTYDKRQAIAARDAARETERALSRRR